jgi:hypothetical protein
MTIRNFPSFEEVDKCLAYDPDTGIFRWKITLGSRARQGDLTGCVTRPHGYVVIRISGINYGAARLAWLLMTGVHPDYEIDHIDGNPTNNRFENLREATRLQNAQNVKMTTRNTSGIRGVHWRADCEKWRALIFVNGKQIHLGYFNAARDAQDAYVKAAKHHFGKFMRAA